MIISTPVIISLIFILIRLFGFRKNIALIASFAVLEKNCIFPPRTRICASNEFTVARKVPWDQRSRRSKFLTVMIKFFEEMLRTLIAITHEDPDVGLVTGDRPCLSKHSLEQLRPDIPALTARMNGNVLNIGETPTHSVRDHPNDLILVFGNHGIGLELSAGNPLPRLAGSRSLDDTTEICLRRWKFQCVFHDRPDLFNITVEHPSNMTTKRLAVGGAEGLRWIFIGETHGNIKNYATYYVNIFTRLFDH